MNPLEATHLDGPKLIAWIRGRGLLHKGHVKSEVGKRWECQVRRWEHGRAVKIPTADEFLVALDIALGEVPDEIYRIRPAQAGSPISAHAHERILQLGSDPKLTFAAIGRLVGCDPKTAKAHLVKAGAIA